MSDDSNALGLGGAFGSAGGTALDLGDTFGRKSTPAAASNSGYRDRGAEYGEAPSLLTSLHVTAPVYAHQVDGPSYGYDALYAAAPGPAAPPPTHTPAVPSGFFDRGGSGSAPTNSSASDQEELLQKALQEEMYRSNRTGRGADPFKKVVVPQMLEVKQSALTSSGRPMETMGQAGLQAAFGPQYAAKLKKEAGVKPEAGLRRKHQIGSLYYDAKVRELELYENKSKGMKSKSQTQGKYGWV